MLSWGRPFRMSSPLLTDFAPVQIECGWGFSAVLNKSGDVLVWWPFSEEMTTRIGERNVELDGQGDKRAEVTDGVIPCVISDLIVNPVKLPGLPPLPELPGTNTSAGVETRIVQIGGLDLHIVGLTNKGHVLKFGSLGDETTVSQGSWEYVSHLFYQVFPDLTVV